MTENHHFLVQQVGKGDKEALAALYRAYERPVYKFIVSRLNDPHEASDILHEVFMDIWRVAASFEGEAKCEPGYSELRTARSSTCTASGRASP
ncbi:RNA polymerase sigma factor [Pararhodobacter zhoushanensis]|uniref:RNA polymerase sigma-70 region 2 domain-containing protein n=1 Tax=Pararhodobacter zhoushanensis TaxID=2479545 RepID=A0ABT3H4P5_9RHOB|nr:sigma factor [Pararhodobacter zhoushanensis]MCW1934743.1 hypothetical protein [Pararhodobacter zhoushanensis]